MNTRSAIALVVFGLFLTQCTAVSPSQCNRLRPSPRVAAILAWPDEGGSVYYQAKRTDGFDYRTNLAKAAVGEESALSKLFVYTRTNHLMGEGSESHIEVLGELLKQWGDLDYAKILQLESTTVIREVAVQLDEFWGHPGWPKAKYPVTERLCAQTAKAEQPADGKTPEAPQALH